MLNAQCSMLNGGTGARAGASTPCGRQGPSRAGTGSPRPSGRGWPGPHVTPGKARRGPAEGRPARQGGVGRVREERQARRADREAAHCRQPPRRAWTLPGLRPCACRRGARCPALTDGATLCRASGPARSAFEVRCLCVPRSRFRVPGSRFRAPPAPPLPLVAAVPRFDARAASKRAPEPRTAPWAYGGTSKPGEGHSWSISTRRVPCSCGCWHEHVFPVGGRDMLTQTAA